MPKGIYHRRRKRRSRNPNQTWKVHNPALAKQLSHLITQLTKLQKELANG